MTAGVRIEEVWLVRHGVTEANRLQIVQGHRDEPLGATGEEQARRLGASLAARGVRFDAVVASDLSRATRTAELCCGPIGGRVVADPGFREACYGALEGGPRAALRAYRDLPEPEASTVAPPGGESLSAMQARVLTAFRTWTERSAPGPRLAIFTHGGPIAALVCHALDTPIGPRVMRAFRRDNSGVSVLRRPRSRPDAWQIVTLNDLRHLDAWADTARGADDGIA